MSPRNCSESYAHFCNPIKLLKQMEHHAINLLSVNLGDWIYIACCKFGSVRVLVVSFLVYFMRLQKIEEIYWRGVWGGTWSKMVVKHFTDLGNLGKLCSATFGKWKRPPGNAKSIRMEVRAFWNQWFHKLSLSMKSHIFSNTKPAFPGSLRRVSFQGT